MVRDVQHPAESGEAGPDRHHAAGRQPAELDREQHDQHQPDPEGRGSVGEQDEDGDGAVGRPVDVAGRGHPEDHAERYRHRQARAHQDEGGGEPVQHELEHGRVVAEGEAEVEVDHAPDVARELGDERTVEAEALAQHGDVLGRGRACLTGEHVDDVPRGELEDQEAHHDDDQDGGHGLDEASRHEARDARSGQHHPNTGNWAGLLARIVHERSTHAASGGPIGETQLER
jgi:hypothetical protein